MLSCEDCIRASSDDQNDIAILERSNNVTRKLGIFSLKGKAAEVKVDFPDGSYENHFDNSTVVIQQGKLRCAGVPVILTCEV